MAKEEKGKDAQVVIPSPIIQAWWKEFEDNEQISGLVGELGSTDKIMKLAESKKGSAIADRLKALASTIADTDQAKQLVDLATGQATKAAAQLEEGAKDAISAVEGANPDAAKEKAAELSQYTAMSLENTVAELAGREDTKQLLAKGEELLKDVGVKKEDLTADNLLKKASDFIPEVTERANKLLSSEGKENSRKGTEQLGTEQPQYARN